MRSINRQKNCSAHLAALVAVLWRGELHFSKLMDSLHQQKGAHLAALVADLLLEGAAQLLGAVAAGQNMQNTTGLVECGQQNWQKCG